MLVYRPIRQPRYEPKILFNCRHINEASEANLDVYKRIIIWQPFFEQVYIVKFKFQGNVTTLNNLLVDYYLSMLMNVLVREVAA